MTAETGFTTAARLYADLGWPFDVAIVKLEHAEWLVEQGRVDEAQPLAAEARENFERLRAKPYLERLERLHGCGAGLFHKVAPRLLDWADGRATRMARGIRAAAYASGFDIYLRNLWLIRAEKRAI